MYEADHGASANWSTIVVTTVGLGIGSSLLEQQTSVSEGVLARCFVIRIPAPDKGGIFDLVSGTSTSDLIDRLHKLLSRNYGLVWERFVQHIEADFDDAQRRFNQYALEFIRTCRKNSTGIEQRIIRKFADEYAAARLAIDADIDLYSEAQLRNAVKKALHDALAPVRTRLERVTEIVNDLLTGSINVPGEEPVCEQSKRKGRHTLFVWCDRIARSRISEHRWMEFMNFAEESGSLVTTERSRRTNKAMRSDGRKRAYIFDTRALKRALRRQNL